MLVRSHRIRCTRRHLAQYSNDAAGNYENFKKLRAYPFRLAPESAQRAMARVAAPLCHDFRSLASFWNVFFSPSNSLRPTRFSAAYFPAWIVNAEIEADITYGDARRRGTIIFNNCYIPGSHIPTLSAAPLWGTELESERPVPCMVPQPQLGDSIRSEDEPQIFDPSLLRQQGEDVQCIPFTTSPFSLLDVARDLPWTDAVINENLKFAPSSLKVNLLSTHPVLLPLYIAMYEMTGNGVAPGSTLTTWMPAHADTGVMTENFAFKFDDQRMINIILKVFGFLQDISPSSEVFSYFTPEDQVGIRMISFPASKKVSTTIKQWLQRTLESSANISKLSSTIENDDDPRIRPMIEAEKTELKEYFRNETETLLIQRIIEDLKNTSPNATVISFGLGSSKGTTSPEATLQARLDTLLAKKAKLKPQWWAQWESLQSQKPPS